MNNEFLIRLAQPQDAADIAEIYRPMVENTAITFELEAPGEEEMKQRITALQQTHLWLACEHMGKVVAYAYGGMHRARKAYQWTTEVSVYVDSGFHGRHLGGALYTVLLKGLELQGYVLALAGVTVPNAQSERFHHALGFELFANYKGIGFKLGRWYDVAWFRKKLRSIEKPPGKIIHHSEIITSPDWINTLESSLNLINKR